MRSQLNEALARVRDIRQELVHVAVDLTDVLDFLTEAAKAARCTSCRGTGELVGTPGESGLGSAVVTNHPCPDCDGKGFRPCWDPHRT